ncbi:hypothetical protein D3C87_1498630 [compost metagenome]
MPVHIRRHFHGIYPCFAYAFQPDGFPYPGRLHIEAFKAVGDPALLAPGLGAVHAVLRFEHNPVGGTKRHKRGNVKRKGGISSFMLADIGAVHPAFCPVIHALKMQNRPLPGVLRRKLQCPLIPDIGVKFLNADPAGGRFISEGNRNLPGFRERGIPCLRLSAIGIIKAEIPFSIQIEPFLAHKLWSGVIGNI